MDTKAEVHLFVHLILVVEQRQPVLSRPVRNVMFVHTKASGDNLFLKIIALDGVEDHLHCLLKLHPTQHLAGAIKQLKELTAGWINGNKFMQDEFHWQESYLAYSVSPSAVKQVTDYINNQNTYHKTKTLDQELGAFEKFKTDQSAG